MNKEENSQKAIHECHKTIDSDARIYPHYDFPQHSVSKHQTMKVNAINTAIFKGFQEKILQNEKE